MFIFSSHKLLLFSGIRASPRRSPLKQNTWEGARRLRSNGDSGRSRLRPRQSAASLLKSTSDLMERSVGLSTYYFSISENLQNLKWPLTITSIAHYVWEEQNMNTWISKTVYEHLLLHVMHTYCYTNSTPRILAVGTTASLHYIWKMNMKSKKSPFIFHKKKSSNEADTCGYRQKEDTIRDTLRYSLFTQK